MNTKTHIVVTWSALCILIIAVGGCSTSSNAEGERLHALFEREWDYGMARNPLSASRAGDRRFNTLWANVSLAAIEKRYQHALRLHTELKTFNRAGLSEADQLNLDLYERSVTKQIQNYQHRWHLIPLDQRWGIQNIGATADSLRFQYKKDYEDWIKRLKAFPTYMDQTIALMREGIRVGMVHPKVIMQRLPRQIKTQIVDDPTNSSFYKPFLEIHTSVSSEDQKHLQDVGRRIVSQFIVPAYRKFLAFFENEYLPACQDKIGTLHLPNGKELYEARARDFTTTNLTPRQIHQIGLNEVKRIRAQMMDVIKQVKFKGTFDEFLVFLRTDKRFYYETGEELLAAYRELNKRIDPTVVKLFGRMPRMPYGIDPIPPDIAPDTTTAYYMRPAADGTRAGTYAVNLYKPETRPKYEMEALSLHEGVPGHHFQIALAMELKGLPKFRRYSGYTAYIEGWGLYAESLGKELGFYTDPYSLFGRYVYEIWRACRLVVDTGMHYLGWSRQKAIDYMKANTAKSELDIINEIDRYIAWPGQALAYKIGELKIQELRKRAEKQLGPRFDIRAFHDTILLNGAVPLDILEKIVNKWIANVKAGAA